MRLQLEVVGGPVGRFGPVRSPLSHKPAPNRAPNDPDRTSIGVATSEMPFVGGVWIAPDPGKFDLTKDNCTHSRPCFLRLRWPGGTRFFADGHTVSNAPDPRAIVLHLLWEAFFLFGFWETWRVESEASPWASTSAW